MKKRRNYFAFAYKSRMTPVTYGAMTVKVGFILVVLVWTKIVPLSLGIAALVRRRFLKGHLFCVCNDSQVDKRALQCSNCTQWFHFECIALDEKVNEQIWQCSACVISHQRVRR